MNRHPRHRRERGSMVMVVAQMILILVLFLIAGIIIGRMSIQRDEQQNAVDAINLARVHIAKHEGLSAVCNQDVTQRLIEQNLHPAWRGGAEVDCPEPVLMDEVDGVGKLRFSANIRGDFNHPFVWQDQTAPDQVLDPRVDELRGVMVSEIVQASMDRVELPKVVFALDYSGSMNGGFGGGTKVGALRQVVNGLLDLSLAVEFGLVQFNAGVFNTDEIFFDRDHDQIREGLRARPGGLTNYQAAFDASANVLRNRGAEKGYVVFVADGVPTTGGDSFEAARRLWNRGYTVLSIFIGDPRNGRDLLIAVSGSRNDPSNPDFFFEAPTPDALVDAVEEVFRTILCSIGPIDPAPDPNSDLGLFLRLVNGEEIRLELRVNPRDLDEARDEDLAIYNPADQYVKLSEGACNRILFDNATLVARHGSPVLQE